MMREWLMVAALLALSCGVGFGQAAGQVCNESIADSAGYKILRVTPNVRWGASLAADDPVKPGDAYTQANEALARAYVTKQLDAQEPAVLAQLTRVSARFVSSCTIVESAEVCRAGLGTVGGSDKCVTLRVDAYALAIPALGVSGLSLSQPRSPTDTYLNGVPGALLALSPKAGLGTDAALGTTVRVSTRTELAQMLAAFRRTAPVATQSHAQRYRAQIFADGFRSMDAGYYSGSLGFAGSFLLHGAMKQLSAEFRYSAELLPLGEEKLRSNQLTAGLSATVLAGWPVVRTVLVRGAYDHAANALSALGETDGATGSGLHEDGLLAQVATDGVFDTATVRSSVWFERQSGVADQSYRKLVVRAGVERGIAVRAHQTVDLLVLGGYGRADGLVPAQDRFAGGNAGADFLDEKLDSKTIENLPAGPIARSFGAGRLDWIGDATTYGPQSFGHVNVTAAIPIGLSRPLIPTFKVIGNATVADLLKARVDKDNLLEASLKAQGYSEADAVREQARVMNAVRPAVHYIADQANVWSVKPVVLFDWAGVRAGKGNGDSRLGAGGGVQFGVVTAQFQAAYIHSIGDGSAAGNFVFRLSFQNLF